MLKKIERGQGATEYLMMTGVGLVFLLLAAFSLGQALPDLGQAVAPIIQTSNHADIKHGGEAAAIRSCISQMNPGDLQPWKGDSEWFLPCQLNNGMWGVKVCRWADNENDFVECTAFIPKDGTWAKVQRWLYNRATPFKGTPPAGLIQ